MSMKYLDWKGEGEKKAAGYLTAVQQLDQVPE